MFYLGMDVAKAKLDCCLLLDEASGKRKIKVVNNTPSGIVDLLAWVAKQNVSPEALHVVMEATGVYHEQAPMALADAGVMVSIINPAQVKDFGRGLAVRTKTDGVDSVVLARYGVLLKPKAWVPPPQAGDGFADRGGVCRVVLAALAGHAVGRDELWRHQLDGVTVLAKLSRPVVCAGTRFHADQARRQLCDQRQQIREGYFRLDQHSLAVIIYAVYGKHVLGEIDSYGDNPYGLPLSWC
jgi:hypothetical protein